MKQVVMIGVSHHTAPVEVRERLAFSAEQCAAAATELCGSAGFLESAILSTCNRSEVYAVAGEERGAGSLREWYAGFHQVPAETLRDALCMRTGREAVRHLYRVAAGLDSMLLGEAEILGQVREAYKKALGHRSTGAVLNRMFQGALEAGKRVRTQTEIGARPMSVAFAGVKLAERVFGKLRDRRALVLGAGTVAEQVVDHLRNRGLSRLVVANRTQERAEELVRRYGGETAPWASLEDALREPEIVICSTGGAEMVLPGALLARAMEERGNREMFVIDLGVPRNVEPSAAALYNLYLYNLDDLSAIVEQNKQARHEEIPRAESIVAEHVAKFQMWLASQEIAALVWELRQKVEHEREHILQEHLNRMPELSPAARREAARQLAALVDRILREPSEEWGEARLLRGDAPELREVRELLDLAGEKW
jgi:glutamyl-tRNA reductase